MIETLPTSSVAAEIGVTPRRLLAIASRRGLLHLSRKLGQTRFWPPEAVELLRPGPRPGPVPGARARSDPLSSGEA